MVGEWCVRHAACVIRHSCEINEPERQRGTRATSDAPVVRAFSPHEQPAPPSSPRTIRLGSGSQTRATSYKEPHSLNAEKDGRWTVMPPPG